MISDNRSRNMQKALFVVPIMLVLEPGIHRPELIRQGPRKKDLGLFRTRTNVKFEISGRTRAKNKLGKSRTN